MYRLVVYYREVPKTQVTITYGLYKRCEVIESEIPGVSQPYECRQFPASVTDHCEKENTAFCAAWTSAGYLDQLSVGFGALSLMAILFGVSTHSRRRRIWRAVAGLVMLQGEITRGTQRMLRVFSTCFNFISINHQCMQRRAKSLPLPSLPTPTTRMPTHLSIVRAPGWLMSFIP